MFLTLVLTAAILVPSFGAVLELKSVDTATRETAHGNFALFCAEKGAASAEFKAFSEAYDTTPDGPKYFFTSDAAVAKKFCEEQSPRIVMVKGNPRSVASLVYDGDINHSPSIESFVSHNALPPVTFCELSFPPPLDPASRARHTTLTTLPTAL